MNNNIGIFKDCISVVCIKPYKGLILSEVCNIKTLGKSWLCILNRAGKKFLIDAEDLKEYFAPYCITENPVTRDLMRAYLTKSPEATEFEEITPENLFKTLEYNGFITSYQHWQKDNININEYMTMADVVGWCFGNRDSCECCQTENFGEFLAFMLKRVILSPLPKVKEFNFKSYLLENDVYVLTTSGNMTKNYLRVTFNNVDSDFQLNGFSTWFKGDKANADKLIEAAKLLNTLEKV
jgi:hypothetical protein